MYPAEKIRAIQFKLAQGIPQRIISLQEGVSLRTVGTIANGNRVPKVAKPKYRHKGNGSPFGKGGAVRCPTCGTKGEKVCKLCKTIADETPRQRTPEVNEKQERKARRELEAGQAALALAGYDPSRCCGVCGLGPIEYPDRLGTLRCGACHNNTGPAPSLAEIRRLCVQIRGAALAAMRQ